MCPRLSDADAPLPVGLQGRRLLPMRRLAATLYGRAVGLRALAYAQGWLRPAPTPAWTLSVGGIEAGGSGKTPVTAWLLAELLRQGRKPGLLTRGYGRQSHGLRLRARGAAADPADLGDEPAMLVQAGLDVAVAACASRRQGASALMGLGCDSLILDDGFSHRALLRHLDLVVLRAEAPLGTGALLPLGALREPASALKRAQVLWLHTKQGVSPPVPEGLRRLAPRALWVQSHSQLGPARQVGTGTAIPLRGLRVVAAAGIAYPQDFLDSLEHLGAQVVRFLPFEDHCRFSRARVLALQAARAAAGADWLLVTAKDAVKLAPLWPDARLAVLPVQVVVPNPGPLRALLAAQRASLGLPA